MAHVTTFKFKTLPGKRQATLGVFNEWDASERERSVGFQGLMLVASNRDPDEFTAIVRWDSTENYNKNSERPETDAWYQKFRANLVADPEWFDGTLVEQASS